MDISEITFIEWLLSGGLISFILKDIILPIFKKNKQDGESKLTKIEEIVNTLWDEHNQKKHESIKLKTLQDNFTAHERKFEIFAATQTNANNLFSTQFAELKELINHKENNQKNVTSGIFALLERIEDNIDIIKNKK